MQRTDLQKLIADYNKNKGWGRVIRNHPAIRALASLANKSKSDVIDDYDVVKCFLDNPTEPGHASHEIFLKILRKTTVAPDAKATAKFLASLYSKDYNKNILDESTFNAIKNHPQLSDIAWAMQILRLVNLHHEKHLTALTKHPSPRVVAETFYRLYCKGLLNRYSNADIAVIAGCSNPQKMVWHIDKLSKATLPTTMPIDIIKQAFKGLVNHTLDNDNNCAALLRHRDSAWVAEIIIKLDEANILNQNINLNLVFAEKGNKLAYLSEAVSMLGKAKLLNQETFLACYNHKCPHDLATAIINTHKKATPTPDTEKALYEHAQPENFSQVLRKLEKMGMLTQENINACATVDPLSFMVALDRLIEKNCFNQEVPLQLRQDMLEGLITNTPRHRTSSRISNDALNEIADSIHLLFGLGVYSRKNLDTLIAQPYQKLQFTTEAEAIIRASLAINDADPGPLRQNILAATLLHRHPTRFAMAINYLQREGRLTAENATAVSKGAIPMDVASALLVLDEVVKDTNQNKSRYRNACAVHARPLNLAAAIKLLHTDDSLLVRHFNKLARHDSPEMLAEAINILSACGILYRHINHCVASPVPGILAETLTWLNDAGLHTDLTNLTILAADNDEATTREVNATIEILNRTGVLTSSNLRFLKNQRYRLSTINFVLRKLLAVNWLTRENFGRLMRHEHSWLFSQAARQILWNGIAPNYLTVDHINMILVIVAQRGRAHRRDPAPAVLDYVRRHVLLLPAPRAVVPRQRPFNPRQNTHTASVHASVSESATKLMNRYRTELEEKPGVNEVINELKNFVNGLLDDYAGTAKVAENCNMEIYITSAAKRAIERLTNTNPNSDDPAEFSVIPAALYRDRTSNIDLRQLLALAFVAVRDNSQRRGTLEDAQRQLVEGLYEIQRGYNIDETGTDNADFDNAICGGGTFNKIVEKIAWIHPDAEILYITKMQAANKLPIVVKEKAMEYLANKEDPSSEHDKTAFIELLDYLDENPVDKIWGNIKAAVANTMFDEFKSLYDNRRDHREFIGLIDAGQYTMLGDLSEFRKKNVKADSGVASNGMFATQPNGRQGNTDSEERKVDDKVAPGAGL